MSKEELLTAGKIAKELDVPQKLVKVAIEELSLKPDVVKGNCKYYTRPTVDKIKDKIQK